MENYDINPRSFVERYEQGGPDDGIIIDVRELHEWDYYHLERALHIPMNTVPQRLEQLPKDKTLYIVCAHGVRSAVVANYLLEQGFAKIQNVQGGMSAVAELRGFAYD